MGKRAKTVEFLRQLHWTQADALEDILKARDLQLGWITAGEQVEAAVPDDRTETDV